MTPELTVQTIATALGASWASGVNLYAAMLVLGLMNLNGAIDLPAGLEVLSNPIVLFAAGTMFTVEFFADKIPGVDTAWDGLHTFIRIPAGAMMAYGAVEGAGPAVEMASFIMGGGLATASHATKSGSRVLINTSPEPFSNWTASIVEDLAVIGALWTALTHPWIFLCLMGLIILFMIWLLPRIWRGVKKILGFLARLFGGGKKQEDEPSS